MQVLEETLRANPNIFVLGIREQQNELLDTELDLLFVQKMF